MYSLYVNFLKFYPRALCSAFIVFHYIAYMIFSLPVNNFVIFKLYVFLLLYFSFGYLILVWIIFLSCVLNAATHTVRVCVISRFTVHKYQDICHHYNTDLLQCIVIMLQNPVVNFSYCLGLTLTRGYIYCKQRISLSCELIFMKIQWRSWVCTKEIVEFRWQSVECR